MATSNFTRATLSEKTVPELKQIATNMGIDGLRKIRKDDLIDKIMRAQTSAARKAKRVPASDGKTSIKTTKAGGKEDGVYSSFSANVKTPTGDVKTTIKVSAGAASGNFNVLGKTVGAVAERLREVLNIAPGSTALVNGRAAGSDHVIGAQDKVEYVRPAGRKG